MFITLQSIEDGMKSHGFPDQMTQWYINYMKTRSCQSTLFGVTVARYLNKGTPQGGVFSPIAWNLAFDSLLKLTAPNIFYPSKEENRVRLIHSNEEEVLNQRRQRNRSNKKNKAFLLCFVIYYVKHLSLHSLP